MNSFQSRCTALFLALIFIVTATGCQTAPTVESTPFQVPTTLTSPIVAIPSASILLSGEWRFSVFGFTPHWNGSFGPPTFSLNPDQHYFIPDDTPSDSEAADAVRRQVINDHMPILRSNPFVAGAIFWSYRDYRTPTNFKTGLVDAQRNERGSWEVLRDQYAPALIDSVTLSPVVDGQRIPTVALHTRGPVDVDMPAYTLRAYTLHWAVTSTDGGSTFSEGDVSLPILAPGTPWSGEIALTVPCEEYILRSSIVRPTGFSATEHSYDALSQPIP